MLRVEPMRIVSDRGILDKSGDIIGKAEMPSLTKRITLAHKLLVTSEADARSIVSAQEGERRA